MSKQVSLKIALLADKKGYTNNDKRWEYYSQENKCYYSTNVDGGISGKEKTFKRPTRVELQKWLREKRNIDFWIMPLFNGVLNDGVFLGYNVQFHPYIANIEYQKKYEKAFDFALLKSLKSIK